MVKEIPGTLVRLPHRPDRPARIGVVANTYGEMPPSVLSHLEGVDLILHAGDVGEVSVITRLETVAPVYAVAGDYDRRSLLPPHRILRVGGKSIVLTHGHLMSGLGHALKAFLAAEGDEQRDHWSDRLITAFPKTDLLIFAHPVAAYRGFHGHTLIVNPGAVAATPGEESFAGPSVAVLTMGRVAEAALYQLGPVQAGAPRLATAP